MRDNLLNKLFSNFFDSSPSLPTLDTEKIVEKLFVLNTTCFPLKRAVLECKVSDFKSEFQQNHQQISADGIHALTFVNDIPAMGMKTFDIGVERQDANFVPVQGETIFCVQTMNT